MGRQPMRHGLRRTNYILRASYALRADLRSVALCTPLRRQPRPVASIRSAYGILMEENKYYDTAGNNR